MGDATSWIALEGATKSEAEKALGKGWLGSPMGEWLLAGKAHSNVVADTKLLTKLSKKWRVVAGDVEEHCMQATACEWRDGKEQWSLEHQGDESPAHLTVRGTPPTGWKKLADKAHAQAKKKPHVDYVFELPSQVAELVLGFNPKNDDD